MNPHLELIAGVFVHKRRFEDRVLGFLGRQGHGPGNRSTRALRGVHDLLGALVYELVVVRPNLYPDSLMDFSRGDFFYFGHLKKNIEKQLD